MTTVLDLPLGQQLRILERAAVPSSRASYIALAVDLDVETVETVIAEAGGPDRMALRVAIASLKARIVKEAMKPVPAPRAPARPRRARRARAAPDPAGPIDPPHPAVPIAAELHQAVHNRDQAEIASVTDPLDRQALVEVCVALAAMLPARLQPEPALLWTNTLADER